MKKETFSQTVEETSVSVVQTEVDSIRTKNITRTAVRVYDGKHLGVAGALGTADMADLQEKAIAGLGQEIPYPFDPIAGNDRSERVRANFASDQEFVEEMRQLLSAIRKHQPEFIFSGKLNLTTVGQTLTNDMGLDYAYQGTVAELGLMIKEKKSANIMDAAMGYDGIHYDRESFLATTDQL